MKFELDEEERAIFEAWDEKHLREYHAGEEPYTGAIGGRISFMITGTSIGQLCSAVCGVCRAKGKDMKVYAECLTDFTDW